MSNKRITVEEIVECYERTGYKFINKIFCNESLKVCCPSYVKYLERPDKTIKDCLLYIEQQYGSPYYRGFLVGIDNIGSYLEPNTYLSEEEYGRWQEGYQDGVAIRKHFIRNEP